MNRSDFFCGRVVVYLLGLLIFLYWLNPESRRAHFDRIGTIQSTTMLLILPIIVSLFSLSLIFFASSRHFHYLLTTISTRQIDSRLPVASFFLFTVIPYFSAYFGQSYVTDFYYRVMRVSNIEPTFADLRTILYGISCQQVNSLGDEIICDPRGSTPIWNYPTILLELRHFGFDIHLLPLLALVFTLMISIAIFLISNSLHNTGRIWLSILVFSPPVLLCFDRMNFDLVIVSLIIFSMKIVAQSELSLPRIFVVLSFLSAATILKFYALPLLLIFAIRTIRNYKYFFVSFLICASTIILMIEDLTSVREYVGRDIRGAVGLNVLTSLLNGSEVALLDSLSLGLVSCLVLIACFTLFYSLNSSFFSFPSFTSMTCFSLSILFLIPWLTTSSYYYRMVAIVFIIPMFISVQRQNFERISAQIATLALYCSPSSLAFVQNILILPLISVLIIFSFKFLVIQKRFLVGEKYG